MPEFTPKLAAILPASRRFHSQQHQPGAYARAALDSAQDAGRLRYDAAGVAFAAVRLDVARALFDLGCRVRIQPGAKPIPSRCQMAHKSAGSFTKAIDSAVIRNGLSLAYLVPVSDLEELIK